MREKREVFFARSSMEDFWVLCRSSGLLLYFLFFRSTLEVEFFDPSQYRDFDMLPPFIFYTLVSIFIIQESQSI
jgi:hypothetical protein